MLKIPRHRDGDKAAGNPALSVLRRTLREILSQFSSWHATLHLSMLRHTEETCARTKGQLETINIEMVFFCFFF